MLLKHFSSGIDHIGVNGAWVLTLDSMRSSAFGLGFGSQMLLLFNVNIFNIRQLVVPAQACVS